MKPCRPTVVAIAALLLTACGSGSSSDTAATDGGSSGGKSSTSELSGDDTPPPPPVEGPTYADPADMRDKILQAKIPYITCGDEVSSYDIAGALYVTCTGRKDEVVRLSVYEDPAVKISAVDVIESDAGTKLYSPYDGWGVSTRDQRTLDDLIRVLDPDNAPETTPMTVAEAKREYERIAQEANDAGEALSNSWDYPDIEDPREQCAQVAVAEGRFADELDHAQWHAEATDEAKALASAVRAESVPVFERCAAAGSLEEADKILSVESTVGDEISAMRKVLGLKPAGTQ